MMHNYDELALKLHHCVYLSTEKQKNPPILILHGLLGSSRNFQSWGKMLSNALPASDIICLDLRNHGRSASQGSTEASYELMAADVKETMDYLNIEKAHLIGHSMGGKTAAVTALRPDMLDRILSVCILDISPVHYEPEEFASVTDTVEVLSSLSGALEAQTSRQEVMELLSRHFTDPTLVAFLMTNLQQKASQSAGFHWKFAVDSIHKSLGNIRSFPSHEGPYPGKALIVKAAKSSFVRSLHIPAIIELFPSYNLATVRDAGHWLHAEKPKETVELVVRFLNSV
eukprot:CAMPEP_0182416116 /NCGR_PEP_ID=MMETSP1167-20130531/225_1 /TAXON_ID=2988 /ORGANISM="Mallomonas Sp, Strain CCMP3275" /LENGTH=284 /DNA_ID=CAMNT_0024588547 /DNA_START=431 /DNA_END=1285 /DNA_ORIENTATION=-